MKRHVLYDIMTCRLVILTDVSKNNIAFIISVSQNNLSKYLWLSKELARRHTPDDFNTQQHPLENFDSVFISLDWLWWIFWLGRECGTYGVQKGCVQDLGVEAFGEGTVWK